MNCPPASLPTLSSPLSSPLSSAPDTVHIPSSPSPIFQSSQFDGMRDLNGDHGVTSNYNESVTTQERLQEVVDTLRRVGWSFKQFLLAISSSYRSVSAPSGDQIHLFHGPGVCRSLRELSYSLPRSLEKLTC